METNPELVSANVNVTTNLLIIDVYLTARDIGRAKTPSFADGPFDALDSIVASRLEDSFVLQIVLLKELPKAPAAQQPVSSLKQVLTSWKVQTESSVAADQKILLARIENCIVTKDNPAGSEVPLFTIQAGQSLQIKNNVRPLILLTGRAPSNT